MLWNKDILQVQKRFTLVITLYILVLGQTNEPQTTTVAQSCISNVATMTSAFFENDSPAQRQNNWELLD